MVAKYIEKLGSEQFNKYMSSVLYKKLKLDFNPKFNAFITDIMYNSTDLSRIGRIKSILLERFLVLTLQLHNPDFYKDFPEIKTMFL